jgi:hypothetical protein
MKIAWFSPLQKKDSVSSYCTDNLIPLIKDWAEITLYSDTFSLKKYHGLQVDHYLNAFKDDIINNYDLYFYQVEDTSYTDFCRQYLGIKPGIVWLHQGFSAHPGPVALSRSPWREIIKAIETKSTVPKNVWSESTFPFLAREMHLALIPLFSSEFAQECFIQHQENTLANAFKKLLNSINQPNFYFLNIPLINEGKKVINLKNEIFTIGMYGSTSTETRYHKVFSALKRINFPYKVIWMVPNGQLEQATKITIEWGLSNINIVEQIAVNDWNDYVGNLNVALHLNISLFGSLHPALDFSVANGVVSLISNIRHGENIPREKIIPIKPGSGESEHIYQAIVTLSEYTGSVLNSGLSECNVDDVAKELKFIINSNKDFLFNAKNEWQKFEEREMQNLNCEFNRIFHA